MRSKSLLSSVGEVFIQLVVWFYRHSTFFLAFSLLLLLLNGLILSIVSGIPLPTAYKIGINIYFSIDSPFSLEFPYSILGLIYLLSGMIFLPSLLGVGIEKCVEREQEQNRIWIALYLDFSRIFPEKSREDLIKMTGEAWEQYKRVSKK